MQLTARERVIAAMERRELDRIPVLPCLQLNHMARVAGISYGEILAHPEKMNDAIYQAREFYDADGLRTWVLPPPDWREGTVAREVDGRMMLLSEKTGQLLAFFDMAGGGKVQLIDPGARIRTRIKIHDRHCWPVGLHVESVADVKKIPVPTACDFHRNGQTKLVRQLAERIAGQFFIVGMAGAGCTMNSVIRFRGSVQGLMDLWDNPVLVDAIIDRCTEASIEEAKALIDAGVDGIYFGDSAASSSMISPEHYSRFCAAAYRRFVSALRAYNSDVKIYQHCCGNYNQILEIAADEGMDALHGLDPSEGMDLADVKRRVGDRVCLFGGVQTLTFLKGTPGQVLEESIQCMNAGGPEGYILDAACAIPPQSPFENVRAMCQAPRG